jgi:site-specific recombinase XerD
MRNKLSIKFYQLITKDSNVKGVLPIYMRITLNRKKAELHTGFSDYSKNWNQSNQESKSENINLELIKKRAKAIELMLESQNKNKPISASIIKDLILGKQKINIELISYLKKYTEQLDIKKELKKISVDKYRQSAKSLENFLQDKFHINDISLDLVDFSFIDNYDLYLKEKYNLQRNTINKYHTRLKTLLLKAFNEGFIIKNPYTSFKLKSQKTQREFLPIEELDKLIKVDLSHNQSLDRVRDVFLFSCYTGLRFQDSQDLKTENLIINNNQQSLRFTQRKTNIASEIPLLDIAIRIINKYEDSNERKVLKRLLPKISNQKVNAYLKIISDLSGLNQQLTHHVARHTFATTICLNNNMPIEILSKLLGHSSIKTTQIYGKITQDYLRNQINSINQKISQ